jgi:hypothetical protein
MNLDSMKRIFLTNIKKFAKVPEGQSDVYTHTVGQKQIETFVYVFHKVTRPITGNDFTELADFLS